MEKLSQEKRLRRIHKVLETWGSKKSTKYLLKVMDMYKDSDILGPRHIFGFLKDLLIHCPGHHRKTASELLGFYAGIKWVQIPAIVEALTMTIEASVHSENFRYVLVNILERFPFMQTLIVGLIKDWISNCSPMLEKVQEIVSLIDVEVSEVEECVKNVIMNDCISIENRKKLLSLLHFKVSTSLECDDFSGDESSFFKDSSSEEETEDLKAQNKEEVKAIKMDFDLETEKLENVSATRSEVSKRANDSMPSLKSPTNNLISSAKEAIYTLNRPVKGPPEILNPADKEYKLRRPLDDPGKECIDHLNSSTTESTQTLCSPAKAVNEFLPTTWDLPTKKPSQSLKPSVLKDSIGEFKNLGAEESVQILCTLTDTHDSSKVFELPRNGKLVIGTEDSSDIGILSPSRYHAEVEAISEPHVAKLVLKSPQPTWVNKVKVSKTCVSLVHGDIIDLSTKRFILKYVDALDTKGDKITHSWGEKRSNAKILPKAQSARNQRESMTSSPDPKPEQRFQPKSFSAKEPFVSRPPPPLTASVKCSPSSFNISNKKPE